MLQPTWLLTPEAAAYLGQKPCTLEKWRSQGRGPRYNKPAGRVRYDVRDLDAFIAEGMVEPVQ